MGAFVVSCSSVPTSLPEESRPGLGKVGFVSLVNDEIHFHYEGTTLFENKGQVVNLPALGVQAYAAKILADYMQLVDISKISIQDHRIELTPFIKKSKDERIPFKFDFAEAQLVLKKIAAKTQIDTILLVYPDAFYDESYTKRTSFSEIGVLFRSFLGAKAAFAHTPLTAVVYSIKDQKILAKTRNNRPIVEIEDVQWKDNVSNYSTQELNIIREAIYSKVKENLIDEIQELNLSK